MDDALLFDEIASAKLSARSRHLRAVRGRVVEAYEGYLDCAPNFGELPALDFTAEQKEALLHAYEVATAPLTKVRAQLLQRVDAARCPFCSVSESSTLDHYVPKERRPQFAVFSRNLVPCCGSCNIRKRDQMAQGSAARLFLHPYYDAVPSAKFVKVDVVIREDALVLAYTLVRPAMMAEVMFEQMRSHFELLRLADRYRVMALNHLRGEYRTFARFFDIEKRGDRLARELSQRSADLAEGVGANNWLVVLYEALSEHSEFCDGGFVVLTRVQ